MVSMYRQAPSVVAAVHLLFTLVSCTPPDTLKQVNVLYRHGDRSPVTIFPSDINKVPGAWPDGLGWLTNIGKQQQYELGKWIGQRYGGFLNISRYDNSEILVQASGIPRCLASAYSNLAGLFPPQNDQVWNKEKFPYWQPIPVQTTPVETDNKLAMHGDCPRYDDLFDKEMQSDKVRKEEEDNKEFYAMIAKAADVKHKTLRDIWEIDDPLVCERAHNMTLNKFAQNKTTLAKLDRLATWSFDLLYGLPEMAKLKGGPLLGEIVANIKKARKSAVKQLPSPKFYMYSAHDTTVAALLSAMQVFDCHQPGYRALIMVELHDIPSIGEVVKVFYRNDTLSKDQPHVLTPPGCETPHCKLDTFIRIANDRIPTDWHKECQSASPRVTPVAKHVAAMVVAVLAVSKWFGAIL